MRFLSKRYVYTSSANIRANSKLNCTALFQTALFIAPPHKNLIRNVRVCGAALLNLP